MSFDTTISAFKKGNLEIDCPVMILTQKKENGTIYRGTGYIRQTENGYLSFKVYASGCETADLVDLFNAQMGVAAGKLLSDDCFFDLEATSTDGTRWVAERVRPGADWRAAETNAVLHGQAYSICGYTARNYDPHYLELHFFEKYDVPLPVMTRSEERGRAYMTRNKAQFDASGCQFEVFGGDDDTVFEVMSDHPFPQAMPQRIQESLQFLTARPAQWRARIQTEGSELCLELMSPWRKSTRSASSAPLASADSLFLEKGWGLFTAFLAYTIANTGHTHWNPLAFHLSNAYEGSANSIDARALVTAVAAEAVASLLVVPKTKEEKKHLSDYQKLLRNFIGKQAEFADLAPRIEGLVGALGNERPQDKMYFLGPIGRVEPSYIKSFSDLRNRHVHPKIKDLAKPDAINMQKLLDDVYKTEVLLHQMVFHIIGYEGPFTDYGAVNFPIKQYPLPLPPAAAVSQQPSRQPLKTLLLRCFTPKRRGCRVDSLNQTDGPLR